MTITLQIDGSLDQRDDSRFLDSNESSVRSMGSRQKESRFRRIPILLRNPLREVAQRSYPLVGRATT